MKRILLALFCLTSVASAEITNPPGGTIPSTTNVLVGDGNGNAAAAGFGASSIVRNDQANSFSGTQTFGSTTSILLGTAGSAVGNIGFRNATSGTATLGPPTGALGTYTVTLPNAASTLPIFGQQITFTGPTAARSYALPDASVTLLRSDGPVFAAGSASASSWPKLTAGTLLTTPEAGALEYDSTDNLHYFTQSTTEGRGRVSAYQYFYLAADGSNISTAANFFGTNSAITLVANQRYKLKAHLYFTKNSAASIQWAILNQNAYTNITGFTIFNPAAGDATAGNIAGTFIASKTAANGQFQLSSSLSAANHVHLMFADFEMGTGGKIEIQVSTGTGSVTPLKGSWVEIERVGSQNVGAWTTNF